MVIMVVAEEHPVKSRFAAGQAIQFKRVFNPRAIQRRQIRSCVKEQAGLPRADFHQITAYLPGSPVYGYIHTDTSLSARLAASVAQLYKRFQYNISSAEKKDIRIVVFYAARDCDLQ